LSILLRSSVTGTFGSMPWCHAITTIGGVKERALEADLTAVRRQLECLAFERLRGPLGARRQLLYDLLCLREQELLAIEAERAGDARGAQRSGR
jgi:hypothetical protein